MAANHPNIDFDLESQILVARLTLEDLETLQASQKGKGRFDAFPSDDQLALQDQLDDIAAHLAALEDFRLARSFEEALRLDQGLIDALSVVDQGEREDREAALAVQGGRPLPQPSASQRALENPLPIQHRSTFYKLNIYTARSSNLQ